MAREIVLDAHRSEWKQQYAEAEALLRGVFADRLVDIQHIGSTAVEGLSAKPTLDILVVVKDLAEVDGISGAMEAQGFLAMGEYGIPGRRYFYRTLASDPFVETHHVHVYQSGNPKYTEELLFRDYLRVDKDARRAYEALKLELAAKFRHDPPAYTDAKAGFIAETLRKARKHFGNSSGTRA